jgi:competence protein ComEA
MVNDWLTGRSRFRPRLVAICRRIESIEEEVMRILKLAALGFIAVLAAAPVLAQAPAPSTSAPTTPARPTPAAPSATPAAPAAAVLIDINSAPKAELVAKLKGVGDVRADAIIKGRPYKGKDELYQKNVIPRAVYDDIKDQIIARQR